MVPVHCTARSQELKIDFLTKNLEIFLSETTRPISIYVCKNVPLVIINQDCSSHLDLSKNMDSGGGGGGGGNLWGEGAGLFSLFPYICI